MKGLRYLRTLKSGLHLISQGVYAQVREEWLGQWLPVKPTVIQFPVNDICNAKCVMCNIGLRKRDREITPEELREILQDPLFSEVRYVGISGGEPTLRADLPEMGRVLVDSLPKLEGVGIITNAVREQMVIERITALSQIVKRKGIFFGVNVSLDGIGEIHDRNRGVEGNFDAAVRVIRECKTVGLNVSIGCTLTPINCYDADDVLEWCRLNDIQNYEFRVAVDIKRVYNEGYSQQWPFSSEQRFHLIMFFDKLSNLQEVDPAHQEFYKSLVSQLAFKSPRTAGCDWRTRGVTLDSRGNVSYCSVQSSILGSALEKSAAKIFKSNIHERNRIVREKCNDCQHDLLGAPPPGRLIKMGLSNVIDPWKKRINNLVPQSNHRLYRDTFEFYEAQKSRPAEWHHVLITGWYGTETAGDKAILGELIYFLRQRSPNCRISLTTLDSKVSQQTIKEMPELSDVRLVEFKNGANPSIIRDVDAVIIGGGPLEEIQETEDILRMFLEANKQRKARILFGCGVGPIYTDGLKHIVGTICKLATGGFLRDEESKSFAMELSGIEFPVACDPALAYFRRWYLENHMRIPEQTGQIITLFRANTNEYLPELNNDVLEKLNRERAGQLADVLEELADSCALNVNLLSMHSIPVGGDDRIFNRTINDNFKKETAAYLEKRYLTLPQLMEQIAPADIAFAMRYHGHLISIAFGIPLLSLDYTRENGKVQSLIRRMGLELYSENWADFSSVRVSSKLKNLFAERKNISSLLMQKTDLLLNQLNQVYSTNFESLVRR